MKRIPWLLIFNIIIVPLWSQEPPVRFQISQFNTSLGIPITLTASIEGADQAEALEFPPNSEWDISYQGGTPQNFTHISSYNGKTQRIIRKSWTGTWQLVPLKKGTLTVPPLGIRFDQKDYRSQVFEVRVSDPNPPEGFKITQGFGQSKMIFGQTADYEMVFYLARDLRALNFVIPILSSSEWEVVPESLEPPPGADVFRFKVKGQNLAAVKSSVMIGNQQYVTLTLKLSFRPLKKGDLEIPSVLASFSVGDGFGRSESLAVVSDPSKVKVLDLPMVGKPSSFSGLIGKLSLKTQVEGRTFHVGDPVAFTMTVDGAVNLKNIDRTALVTYALDPRVWQVGEEKNLSPVSSQWFLRPKVPGNLTIPEMKLNYFDPETESYKEVSTPKIDLVVEGGNQSPGNQVVTLTATKQVETVGLDGNRQLALSTQPGLPFWLFFFPGPLFFLGAMTLKIWNPSLKRKMREKRSRMMVLTKEILASQKEELRSLRFRWKELIKEYDYGPIEVLSPLTRTLEVACFSDMALQDQELWQNWLAVQEANK